MIIALGEYTKGQRRVVIVQLERTDLSELMRDCLIINSDTREKFPPDLEVVLTGLDASQLIQMMQLAGAVQPGGADVHIHDGRGNVIETVKLK